MTNNTKLTIVECTDLPTHPSDNVVYRLLPKNADLAYYNERTDRNVGWITPPEQKMLKHSVVGIAGCGGMGGLIAATLSRAGVGEIRIADIEPFDVSNINRQFAATRGNVGVSKVFATARMLRDITDDTILIVYPQGITPETVDHFLEKCDIVCDEIEFWAVGARILLHQYAREKNITLFNCNTVGHRVNLFHYTSKSMHVEDVLRLSYKEARDLQERVQTGTATQDEVSHIMNTVLTAFVPVIPEYFKGLGDAVKSRLLEEGAASIIATNPPMASGFMANHILFHLLRDSGTQREYVPPPLMPGYLMIDAALMKAEIVTKKWW